MAFDQIVTVTLRPGTEADFIAAANALAAGARATEPNTLDYRVYRCRDKADTFIFIESYTDEAALETHRNNPAIAEQFAAVGKCLAGRPVLEVIEAV